MYSIYMKDSKTSHKTSLPDTFLSFLLVAFSFAAVFCLALLQVLQLIWGRKISGKIEGDPAWSTDQNIQCIVHERQTVSKS